MFFISFVVVDEDGMVDKHEHIFDVYTKMYDFIGCNVKVLSAQDLRDYYKSKHPELFIRHSDTSSSDSSDIETGCSDSSDSDASYSDTSDGSSSRFDVEVYQAAEFFVEVHSNGHFILDECSFNKVGL